jgi:hypothetical protein
MRTRYAGDQRRHAVFRGVIRRNLDLTEVFRRGGTRLIAADLWICPFRSIPGESCAFRPLGGTRSRCEP